MEITKFNDISVLHLCGEVTLLEMDRIESIIKSISATNGKRILIDMSEVDYVHYRIIKRLADNQEIRFVNATGETRDVLRFIGADQKLDDYGNVSEAVLRLLASSHPASLEQTYH